METPFSMRLKDLLSIAANPDLSIPVRGRAYEDMFCHLLEGIPGVGPLMRNRLNSFRTEEVDVLVPNLRDPQGLVRLPEVFLVECKNWSAPVGTSEVAYFVTRLRNRGCDLGILVAAHGVTGDAAQLTDSYYEGAVALRDRIRIVVVTTDDLVRLTCSEEVTDLLHKRFLCLYASGTFDLC